MEVYVDDEAKLTLHGLQQHYVKLQDREKNRKLFDLLDALEFNQVRSRRCKCVYILHSSFHFLFSFVSFPQPPPFFSKGDNLCEVGAALHGSVAAPGRAELPSDLHSPRDAPGREVCGVEGLALMRFSLYGLGGGIVILNVGHLVVLLPLQALSLWLGADQIMMYSPSTALESHSASPGSPQWGAGVPVQTTAYSLCLPAAPRGQLPGR